MFPFKKNRIFIVFFRQIFYFLFFFSDFFPLWEKDWKIFHPFFPTSLTFSVFQHKMAPADVNQGRHLIETASTRNF